MDSLSEDLASCAVGDDLPSFTKPPVTRTTLALFAGASNDHNPIHIDIDVARAAGMDDVFAQGMLVMAYLGQLLTGWAPQNSIRRFGVRFGAVTHLNDEITCSGKIVEKLKVDDELCFRIELVAADQAGVPKLSGEALVAIAGEQVND